MPTIKYNNSPEHEKAIQAALPQKTITEEILFPAINNALQPILIDALKVEIEIYKAFPKPNSKFDLETFNPRNPRTCFMGQGFAHNGQGLYENWYDADLKTYRTRVGTINHKVWGDVTLLEIWGADHFEHHPEMVKEVFKYTFNKTKELPALIFESNPFLINEKTGTYLMSEEEIAEEKEREDIIIKAHARNKKRNNDDEDAEDQKVNR